jgi:hypothetical protein
MSIIRSPYDKNALKINAYCMNIRSGSKKHALTANLYMRA